MLIVRDGRKRVVVGGGGDESCHPSPPLFLQAAVVAGTADGNGGGNGCDGCDCVAAAVARQRRWCEVNGVVRLSSRPESGAGATGR